MKTALVVIPAVVPSDSKAKIVTEVKFKIRKDSFIVAKLSGYFCFFPFWFMFFSVLISDWRLTFF